MTRLLLSLLACFFATDAAAEELQAGRTYGSGAVVRSERLGVGFRVPEGWTGEVSGEFFVMSSTVEGLIALVAEEATLAEAREFLSAPQDLGDGYFFSPTANPEVAGDAVSVACTIMNGGQSWPGETTIRVGGHGMSVAVISTGEQSVFDRVKSLGKAVVDGIEFKEPLAPRPGRSSGPWVAEIAGQSLNLYSTTSSSTSKTVITACADGRFSRSHSASGATETGAFDTAWASYAGNSNHRGKWSVVGNELVLFYDDGDEATYELSRNEQGHFLMNGTRWLRAATSCE